jgi:DNA replication protein DnaC
VTLAETAEAAEREREARAYRAAPDNPEYIARLVQAGFDDERLHPATLRNFDTADNPRGHAAAINFVKAILNRDNAKAGEIRRWLYLHGFTGVGKSHLLIGIDRALYVAGFPGRVVIDVIPSLVRRIQSGYSSGRADDLVESRLTADVWLGDDLGRGKQRDDAVWLVSEIGCRRVGRWTAWSSNYDRAGLVRRNEEYEVLASRLGPAYCWGEVLAGRDRRDDAPPAQLSAA